ncbi:hypothetical protein SAMN04488128_1011771 [Chitinophaga eiseniae]|uniref:Uncharacterized protein n=1 Tax=Chitinophaga eiseniae TaxID=634771 RepID=A0A1T4NV62_9BACT|nr:hypothetical protein SAMN04488128_1011771 [Chitinophaga eiseniae]
MFKDENTLTSEHRMFVAQLCAYIRQFDLTLFFT